MNLKHDIEAPLCALKTIFAILKEEGKLTSRQETNAELSLKRIRELIKQYEDENKQSK